MLYDQQPTDPKVIEKSRKAEQERIARIEEEKRLTKLKKEREAQEAAQQNPKP